MNLKFVFVFLLVMNLGACAVSPQFYEGNRRSNAETAELFNGKGEGDFRVRVARINGQKRPLTNHVELLPGRYELSIRCYIANRPNQFPFRSGYFLKVESGKRYEIYEDRRDCESFRVLQYPRSVVKNSLDRIVGTKPEEVWILTSKGMITRDSRNAITRKVAEYESQLEMQEFNKRRAMPMLVGQKICKNDHGWIRAGNVERIEGYNILIRLRLGDCS